MKLRDRLEANKARGDQFEDIVVCLDEETGGRRSELLTQLRAKVKEIEAAKKTKARDARLGQADPVKALEAESRSIRQDLAALDVEEAARLITVRVHKAAGTEWAAIASRFPARKDSIQDLSFGFNLYALMQMEGRRWCRVIEDGEPAPFEVVTEGGKVVYDEWAEFGQQLAGDEFQQLIDAVFRLNVWGPQQRRERLGKARSSTNASNSPGS